MKNLSFFVIASLFISLVMSSCKPSRDVSSGAFLQKRKYTKGYHINKPPKLRENLKAANSKPAVQPATARAYKPDRQEKVIEPSRNLVSYLDVPAPVQPAAPAPEIVRQQQQHFNRLATKANPVLDTTKPKEGSKALALVGFICGIVGFFLWVAVITAAFSFELALVLFLLSILLSIVAIVMSAIGWNNGNAFAIVGLVLGILVLFLSLLFLLIGLAYY